MFAIKQKFDGELDQHLIDLVARADLANNFNDRVMKGLRTDNAPKNVAELLAELDLFVQNKVGENLDKLGAEMRQKISTLLKAEDPRVAAFKRDNQSYAEAASALLGERNSFADAYRLTLHALKVKIASNTLGAVVPLRNSRTDTGIRNTSEFAPVTHSDQLIGLTEDLNALYESVILQQK